MSGQPPRDPWGQVSGGFKLRVSALAAIGLALPFCPGDNPGAGLASACVLAAAGGLYWLRATERNVSSERAAGLKQLDNRRWVLFALAALLIPLMWVMAQNAEVP